MSQKNSGYLNSRRAVLHAIGSGAGAVTLAAAGTPLQAALLPNARRTEQYDVVVVGNGLAGMSAALAAQQAGAKVVVVDKQTESRSGGNSRLAGGLIAIPSDATPQARATFLEEFVNKAQGHGNVDLYKVIAERVLGDVEWLRSNGVEFLPPAPLAPYRLNTVTAAPAAYFGMPRALSALRKKFVEGGGKVVYETKARSLLMDERAGVVGLKASAPDGQLVDYRSEAVVIASGGYAGSRELMETFIDPNAGGMLVRGARWATGDGLVMAHEAGAALVNMSGVSALHIAAVAVTQPSSGNPFLALPYAIAINKAGRRFVDESRGYVAVGKAATSQPEQTVALVMGEDVFKQPTPQLSAATFQKLNIPIVEASSIEELASKIGVPSTALTQTINEFNAGVRDGKAPALTPPKSALASRVQGPKYYAFHPLKPGVTLTFGGIAINGRAQALESDGRPVRGLFAAGECAGGLYYDDYIGGASLANCLVMGRIAGAGAAAEKSA